MLSLLQIIRAKVPSCQRFPANRTGLAHNFVRCAKRSLPRRGDLCAISKCGQMCLCRGFYRWAERQTAWQMEGMDSPWPEEVGESSAPVGQNNTRFHRPARRPGMRWAHSTAAEQPQPEPPLWTSCSFRSNRSSPQSL